MEFKYFLTYFNDMTQGLGNIQFQT